MLLRPNTWLIILSKLSNNFKNVNNFNIKILFLILGIALSDDHLFVCDKDLKAVFKISIKTGMVVRRVSMHGEPYKISVNKKNAVVTDIMDHSINIYDIESMTLLKDAIIEQDDRKNGPYSIHITNDDLIFIKNLCFETEM